MIFPSRFVSDKSSQGGQSVETAENCERFGVHTKQEFILEEI